jgi:chromate reductase
MPTYNLLAISGSLRKASYNSGLARAFKERAPEGVTIEIVNIEDIPLYHQDSEGEFPKVVADLKAKIRSADGIIISTPEYNRSIPGVLKNVIDWTSRPYGDSAWNEKPVCVVGVSVAPTGTAPAQFHLKQVLSYLNTHVPGQPEFYLGLAGSKFDEAGNLTDEDAKKHIDSSLSIFTKFIETLR